jgi:hypothetical protein
VNTSPFTVEEIDALQVVLHAAMTEASKEGIEVPISVLLARLFAAASTGERDPEKLKAAALNKRENGAAEREYGGLLRHKVEPAQMLDTSPPTQEKQR